MIVNRGATRMKIRLGARGVFIVIFAVAIASNSLARASAKNTTNGCGGDFTGYRYTVSSPNYPENYPERQDCVYTLHGSEPDKCEQVFHLQFLDFALKPSENCYEDYLRIGDRSFYCGSVVGVRSYPGSNNSLALRFRSAGGRGAKGFKISVTTSPCVSSQSNNRNDANSTEQRRTEEVNEFGTRRTGEVKIGSRNDVEGVGVLEAENYYPVYRPEMVLTPEDKGRSEGEGPSPLRIESLEKSEKNVSQRAQQITPKYLAKRLELPVHRSKEFRDAATTKLEVVTPTSINSEHSPKASSHLFEPPATRESTGKSTGSGAFARFSPANASRDPKSDVENLVTPPPSDLELPNRWTTVFREPASTNVTGRLPLVEGRERANRKFVAPARSYGVPDGPYYPPVRVFHPDIKPGEVPESSSGTADCQGHTNLEPDLEATANFRRDRPGLIDTAGTGSPSGLENNFHPATTYGAPGSNYPRNVPSTHLDERPSFDYAPPANYFPGNNFVTGSGRPDGWIPSPGSPTNHVGNGYPNFLPSSGIGAGSIYPGDTHPGSGGRYSGCCNTVYSAQRFLLASPGFPSILYSGNSYECIYSIRPYSPNTCRMRLNFKFFNHGTDDRFCSSGYVEIDGRRICGCKKSLSIVSSVSSSFPKVIGVRYSGYPRTQLNGFLIEVIQEPCANGYPFGSRRKKDVGNVARDTISSNFDGSSDIGNSSLQLRTKRNLGYSYPKPNFGLVGVPGASQSWNSGGSVETGIRQLPNEGTSAANFLSPLLTCQVLSFFDWSIAAKEVYLRGARCVRDGEKLPGYPGTGGPGASYPSYTGNGWSGNWNPGTVNPGYPGSGGAGTVNPGYPGSGGGGTVNPGYPGSGGAGTVNPGYPGSGGAGTVNPGYPGSGGAGTVNPGYPGSGGAGTVNPGYPGSGGAGTVNPGYPGNGWSGNWNPVYPGSGGSGTVNPGYPGSGGVGTVNPGYPGSGGAGTVNPGYPGFGGWNFPASKCEDVNVIEGIISSPQYPTNYPNNVNKCFRFYKAPDSCQLELAILDFDLENSAGCTKDYVAFSGQNQRYCGRSLAGSKTFLDISRSNVVDIYFVSDGFGSGRGFNAGFSQIPCRGSINH